tara:strand:+ start:205 stop:474 length:270 start_codon:yes stop_codon:yes gene_type:complete
MADLKARGSTRNYGITYSSGFGSVDVARQGDQTTTTVTKNLGGGWEGTLSGGRNQPTTVGASRTSNSGTFSVTATPSRKSYGITYSKGF